MGRRTTKDAIADSYLRLLKDGVSDANVTDIIRESCVSRQTYYYHFSGLDDLLEYVVGRIIDDLKSKCADTKDTKETFTVILEGLFSNLDIIRAVYKGPKKDAHMKVIYDLIADFIREGLVHNSAMARRLSVSEMDLIVSIYSHGIMGLLLDAVQGNVQPDAKAITDTIYSLYSGRMPMFD